MVPQSLIYTGEFRILEFPVLCVLQYQYTFVIKNNCWMKNTGGSSIVCFTILVLPVLLDEEYQSFQYCVLYKTVKGQYCWMKNTRVSSIVCFTILATVLRTDASYYPILCYIHIDTTSSACTWYDYKCLLFVHFVFCLIS